MVPAADVVRRAGKGVVPAFGLFFQHLCSQQGVALQGTALGLGQWAFLVQQVLADLHFANVVQRGGQRDILPLLRAQMQIGVFFNQAVQNALSKTPDMLDMQTAFAVSELDDLAEHADEHRHVFLAFANLLGHHANQAALFGIELDVIGHAAIDDIIGRAHFIRPADKRL